MGQVPLPAYVSSAILMLMHDSSKSDVSADCLHCDPSSPTFNYRLQDAGEFHVVCDAYPIAKGHLLVIPKSHLSCIGEYKAQLYEQYRALHARVAGFVRSTYGSVAVFEHGKFGQTVFHSHIHFLPFTGLPEAIVPEGADKLRPLADMADLRTIFDREGGYLFFSIGDTSWTVDPSLTVPRFFRDRFAAALGVPERGNWKAMSQDPALMQAVRSENESVRQNWQTYFANR